MQALRRYVLPFLLAAFLAGPWLAGCAGMPHQEMSDARQAIRAAERAGAQKHAPELLGEAKALVETARQEGSFGVAYTYSEPLVHLEYVLEAAGLARKAGLKNVLVSNGYINREPADELLAVVDAANIDLKAFDPAFYREETGGDLEEVKRFISQAAGRIHLEVTTLVIPTKTDSPSQIEGIARFLASLDRNIPLHLSCYYPQYRYSLPPTPVETVQELAVIARRHLPYVYMGNVGLEETNTFCPECGNLLIRRRGYSTAVLGARNGACTRCRAPSPIICSP